VAALLEARGVEVHFRWRRRHLFGATGVTKAVDGVSLALEPGETLALVGESGCGKSTLARALLGLVPLTAGTVQTCGAPVSSLRRKELRAFRQRVQIVFQDPFASLSPKMRVARIIAEPLRVHSTVASAEVPGEVTRLLTEVGLAAEHGERYPHELSGGQRQRVALARALACRPSLLVCDEPTSALDVSIQAQILNLFRDIQDRRGLAVLLISHDLAVVRFLASRVAVMYAGRIVEVGPREAVLNRPAHPYTAALLAASPSLHVLGPAGAEVDPQPSTAVGVAWDGPLRGAVAASRGCAYAPRCPRAEARCSTEAPRLVPLEPEREVACHAPASPAQEMAE
jgi:peptide/nickel transport system ATP-binding protein